MHSSFGTAGVNRSYHSNQPPAQATLVSPAGGVVQLPAAAFGAYPGSGATTAYTLSFEAWFQTRAYGHRLTLTWSAGAVSIAGADGPLAGGQLLGAPGPGRPGHLGGQQPGHRGRQPAAAALELHL